ncbi:hypothetical protein [Roseateles violae]|uniref:Uncharacterized protein n=1 Tax=Roseateles violae TaxID=3058042 RepID=A0ABT8DUW7_9BURK|nr:hypothetical protein [Pelomonas sp. PFR6]MDN3922106.1 hypothetical protein [Pelomonas sp. PFR6]
MVKRVAMANEHAFARVEQTSSELPSPDQHLIQLTVADGKVVAYFGSLRS